MRGELTTAVPALIDTFSLQSAPCLLAGKTRTICYFPRTLCSVCLPAGSVVSMCGVQSPPPPFAKIQTGGDLTRRQLDVSRQDEIDSLGRFLTSKDHLKRNIANIHIERVFNNGGNDVGSYEHSVQVKLEVWRCNLWEGARSYIWKRLGSDIWERGNGMKISSSRIHQK